MVVVSATLCGGAVQKVNAQTATVTSAKPNLKIEKKADGVTYKPASGPLSTRWDKLVSPTNALPDYPRPQMVRSAWQNLNGLWDYGFTVSTIVAPPSSYVGQILVPYPLESSLSGVRSASVPDQRLWYRRALTVPNSWTGKGQRVLLHFGAVNWDSSVWLNGKRMGLHRGGFDGFEYDITDSLKSGDGNELIVSAWNPLRSDTPDAQILGKQRLRPGGIFYTGATGIWQTVWMEVVPATHIASLKITPDVDSSSLRVKVNTGSMDVAQVQVAVLDGKKTVATTTGASSDEIRLPISAPHLWTPNDPHLYNLKISLLKGGKAIDTVASYAAMRNVSLGKDAEGRNRLMLNDKFVFQVGLLDQGYWPDGIYTAPTDEALRYDIEVSKKLGYNLLRKHAKVEPERWYYWTDRLGILVWQDMPQAFGGRDGALTDEVKEQWDLEWKREIEGFYNHPSIIVWTTFNEGWGQHDTERIVALTKQLDPTRLVNNASGWTDMKVGDIADTHAYPGPGSGRPESTRAAVNGEFGGITMRIDGHMWTQDVFGYGSTLRSTTLVTKRYQDLLRKAYKMRDELGTSAFVYTQLTDVEQESNGILTYDRAIIKPDVTITKAANEGQFLPLPPNPNPDILPTSEEEGHDWLYTIDKPATNNWMQTTFEAAGWKTGQAGFGHEVGTIRTPWTTDDIWLRREVTLPANLPARLAFTAFHDEDVEIYINGVLAATAKGYVTSYVTLPMTAEGRAALKPGKNLIAVHCHQTTGGQYIDIGITKAE